MEGEHQDSQAQDIGAHSDGKRAASQEHPQTQSQMEAEEAYLMAQAASLADTKKRRKE